MITEVIYQPQTGLAIIKKDACRASFSFFNDFVKTEFNTVSRKSESALRILGIAFNTYENTLLQIKFYVCAFNNKRQQANP